MTLEQLLADLDHAGVCTLDTGGRITAAEARRLACTAGIIPVVLGGKSQVLDVGRKTPTPHRDDAPRDGRARRRLHRRGLRNTTRPLPRPPRHTLVPGGRTNVDDRPPALPPPPPPHPRPPVRDPTPTRRQGQLPPADVSQHADAGRSGHPLMPRSGRVKDLLLNGIAAPLVRSRACGPQVRERLQSRPPCPRHWGDSSPVDGSASSSVARTTSTWALTRIPATLRPEARTHHSGLVSTCCCSQIGEIDPQPRPTQHRTEGASDHDRQLH